MLAYQETSTAGMQSFHIADPADPGREPAHWPYPRTGGKNADVKLGVVAARGGPTTWVRWDRDAYPYLAAVTWEENAPLTILVQNREQTEERLLAVDAATGATTTLLSESDPAWINLVRGMPEWFVNLVVYNSLGQVVRTLINQELNAGSYRVDFNASDLPSGVYYYNISAWDYRKTNKMILVK